MIIIKKVNKIGKKSIDYYVSHFAESKLMQILLIFA